MKQFKKSFFYVGILGGLGVFMHYVAAHGQKLEAGRGVVAPIAGGSQWTQFLGSLTHNLSNPLSTLLAQIISILLLTRAFSVVCRKVGQPTVIGEILAGIVLGPSLVGTLFPGFFAGLFPAGSLANLRVLSDFGLILFMFVIGMEIDFKVITKKAQDSIVISHASIVIPFALGMGLAYFLYTAFAPPGVSFFSFSLFLGIAMSITAFPVLARIVQERGLHTTRLGAMVITCAAADDITAWCLLAALIAYVKAGTFGNAVYIMGLSLLYVGLMLRVVRPLLNRVATVLAAREHARLTLSAVFFFTLLLSSYATEVIGIHALFGAFLAGAVMPDSEKLRSLFVNKVRDVALVILLPLFFVHTGLRTQIGLLGDPSLWLVTAAIIGVAVTGKFAGSALAARLVGQSWHDSLAIGALMNTRGLMELVVLNIGYDLGILKPEIFSMMVVMALVTTCMTGPALNVIGALLGKRELAGAR